MEGGRTPSPSRQHALLFPFPAQGHINPMLQFGKFLASRDILVTFVNTEFTHERMIKSVDAEDNDDQNQSELRYEVIPDGLSPDHGRTLKLPELCKSLAEKGPLYLEELLHKLMHPATNEIPPVTFIVADGVLSFAQAVADKFEVPRIAFWTTSACGFSAYFHMPLLIEKGYIPLTGEEDDEREITCIPAMETLRMKDLPSFLRARDASDFMFGHLLGEGQATRSAAAVLLNTYEEMEGPVLRQLSTYFPVLAVGPIFNEGSESIWKEESGCLRWLDGQEAASVIYVCFGSVAVLSTEQLVEFAWGLEASNQAFLWAMRPDLVEGSSAVLPAELMESVRERSCFVKWAPQRKVLAHPAVGGFLTHSGWNSTLESVCEGVPMLCWPSFAEQPTNRRFVSQVWKVGFEVDDNPCRAHVEALVRRLITGSDEEVQEIRRRVKHLKQCAKTALRPGGSSDRNVEKLWTQIVPASPPQ